MRRFAICAFVVSALSTAALAGPCIPGTLQSYINLGSGGCTDGNAVFGNFVTVLGQNGFTQLSPGVVNVAPGGTAANPSLMFTLNQSANAGGKFESIFRFTATGSLTSATVSLTNPSATVDGVVLAVLNVCPGANFAGTSPTGCPAQGTPIAEFDSGGSMLSDSATFAATSFFDVFVDLSVDGGLDGSATLVSSTVTLAAAATNSVPEPAALPLMLTGMAGLGWFARRRNRFTEER